VLEAEAAGTARSAAVTTWSRPALAAEATDADVAEPLKFAEQPGTGVVA
jgi:hypothetical protein